MASAGNLRYYDSKLEIFSHVENIFLVMFTVKFSEKILSGCPDTSIELFK